ncbi:MAG TPA: urease accessory UreF family protein [Solirubrobacteraceae bacterium]|jgi:urease accessory protein|nr:urease accessory UreF family protein [Solirubrobacteraceae bacterium]
MAVVATEAHRDAPPDAERLRLTSLLSVLQLSDSAFPSGRYTLSHGLEALSQSGRLPTPSRASQLLTLLSDAIRLGVGPSDGVALACAHRAHGSDGTADLVLLEHADRRLTAVKIPRESREASRRTGRALLDTAVGAFGGPELSQIAARVSAGETPGNHAVILGFLSAWLRIPRLDAVTGELFAFAAGWVGAAVRLGLIDHRTAQGLLHRVRPVVVESALRALDGEVTQISGCTPLLDVMSMRHEQAGLRLFAT